ncbi:MAG: DUF3426 domain-containing protein [Betaproteobacteria bacterium]
MITRCPECSTLFKVVADQLRIADGWVRCGQCSHVFDGTLHLQQELGGQEDVAPVPALVEDVGKAALVPVRRSDEVLAVPQQAPFGVDAFDAASESQQHHMSAALPADNAAAAEPMRAAMASVFDLALPALLDSDAQRTDAQHYFVRASRRESLGTRPWMRWTLRTSAVLLLLLLALQVLVRERDRMAASVPEATPWLQTLCLPLGCRSVPFRNKDAITVEASDLIKIRGDVYRFVVTLRNTGGTELALAAMELTLTDLNDAVLVRRVLLPLDFSATKNTIAAKADWSATLTLGLTLPAGATRVAGYRVLAFYP